MATTDGASLPPWLDIRRGSVTIRVAVRPGASGRGVVRANGAELVIALSAQPEKGRANDELIAFLARAAKVASADIAIVRGRTARHKIVRIAAMDSPALASALAGALA
jgi:uncharacterized protein (TIGR00251 family)